MLVKGKLNYNRRRDSSVAYEGLVKGWELVYDRCPTGGGEDGSVIARSVDRGSTADVTDQIWPASSGQATAPHGQTYERTAPVVGGENLFTGFLTPTNFLRAR